MFNLSKQPFFLNRDGQSVTELAIFGSILIFIISLIFRQGMSAGNFMSSQLQASRYAMSKSLESSTTPGLPTGRNNASTMVIEDRLSGDFSGKFGSRDRIPIIANAGASFSSQMFQQVVFPDDWGNVNHLPHFDMVVNGQSFSFLTANFRTITLPSSQAEATAMGILDCNGDHPNDTRCWDTSCDTGDGFPQPKGCVALHQVMQNFPGSGYSAGSGGFDLGFDGNNVVPNSTPYSPDFKAEVGSAAMAFMWQWRRVRALGQLSTTETIDADGDFHEEQILNSDTDANGRTATVWMIDQQAGDQNFTRNDRDPPASQVGLEDEAQMFSFTEAGTFYRVREGKLFDSRTDQYIRNINSNDHVDIVQRTIQLSNDTGRFCNGDTPRTPFDDFNGVNPVEACNNCFSPAKVQLTCLDVPSLKLFVRSRLVNQGGRSWFTRTEVQP